MRLRFCGIDQELDAYTLKGISNVFAGFLIMLYFGALYIPGNINPYVMSYYHQFDPSIDKGTVFLILPCETLIMTVLFPFGSWLAKRLNGRLQIGIGCVIGLSSSLASSYCTNFWSFYVLYAGGFGVMCGISYVVPVYSGWLYFKNRKGLVTGLVLCGFGFGAFVFDLISTAVVNPNGVNPDDDGYYPPEIFNNFPKMIRLLVIIWTAISIVAIFLFFPHDENLAPKASIYQESDSELSNEKQGNQTSDQVNEQLISEGRKLSDQEDGKLINLSGNVKETLQKDGEVTTKKITLKDCLLSRQFGLIYAMNCMSICNLNLLINNALVLGMFVINTFKQFGQEHIKDENFLTLVGSVSSVFGGLRFFWSYFVDKTGSFKKPYFVLLIIQIITGATIAVAVKVKALYFIWVCLIIFCEGGHFTLLPTACAKFFGEHAAIVYGFAFSFGSIAQIVSSLFVKFFLKQIGYETFFYVSAALSVCSLLILVFIFREKSVC